MGLPVLGEKEKAGGGEGRRQANEQRCSAERYLSLLSVYVNMYVQSYFLLTTDSEKHSALFCEED